MCSGVPKRVHGEKQCPQFLSKSQVYFFYNRYMAFCILYVLIFFNTDNCFQILPGKVDSSLKFFCTTKGGIYITVKNICMNTCTKSISLLFKTLEVTEITNA